MKNWKDGMQKVTRIRNSLAHSSAAFMTKDGFVKLSGEVLVTLRILDGIKCAVTGIDPGEFSASRKC